MCDRMWQNDGGGVKKMGENVDVVYGRPLAHKQNVNQGMFFKEITLVVHWNRWLKNNLLSQYYVPKYLAMNGW